MPNINTKYKYTKKNQVGSKYNINEINQNFGKKCFMRENTRKYISYIFKCYFLRRSLCTNSNAYNNKIPNYIYIFKCYFLRRSLCTNSNAYNNKTPNYIYIFSMLEGEG